MTSMGNVRGSVSRRTQFRLLVALTIVWALWAGWSLLGRATPYTLRVLDDVGTPIAAASIDVNKSQIGTSAEDGTVDVEWSRSATVLEAVPSVLAWLFGVTVRPGWNSTIFAPYFVLGAMFSGVGAVILVLAAFRKAYHLEAYITPKHFTYLAYILVVLASGYLYFMVSEYLTEGYKMHEGTGKLLELLMLGRLAPFFWLFIFGGLLAPIALIAVPYTRTIPGITLAALAVVLGMWLKRFLIVVPGLAEPLLPSSLTIYYPSWVEVAITVGAAAAIPLMLMVFFRFFPVLSIYEMEEAELEHVTAHAAGGV